MASLGMQPEEATVFYYGFLSSHTSEALKEYLKTGKVSGEFQGVLQDSHKLLSDIMKAEKLFGEKKEAAAPSKIALDAFGCALEVIIEHQKEFKIEDVKQLSELFKTLNNTLKELNSGKKPLTTNVEKTRMFFKRLADLMLGHLSTPEEERTSIIY